MRECLPGKKWSGGFVTAEMLIAFVVISLSLSGAILVVFGNESLALDASLSREARDHATDILLGASFLGLTHFVSLENTGTTTTADGFYDQSLSVIDLTPCAKKVTSSISWGKLSGRAHFQTFFSYFFSQENEKMFADSCSGRGEEDWRSPLSHGTLLFPLGSLMTGLDVFNQKLFLTANNATLSTPTFFVVDVSNPDVPNILSSFAIGTSTNAIDVAEHFAYVAVKSRTAQFQVVDISLPAHPVVVATRTLPGVAGVFPEGFSIFYFDSKVYVGTKRTVGHEFHIYDVSQPTNPVWLGSLEMNHNINAISVRDGLAYLATSGNTADLIILDVSDSTSPRRITSLDLPGSQDGKSLYLLGNRLYLGRFRSTHPLEPEFYILDIHNPSVNIPTIGSLYLKADVNSIYTTGNFVFLGTGDPLQELKTISISNPVLPTLVASASFNLPFPLVGLDYERGFVYSALKGTDGLRIFSAP